MSDINYTADVLTVLAEDWLRAKFPDALIMREFNAAKWGNALIDVVAVTKNKIIGIEIKGQGDSLTRLKLQGSAYSMVASHMFLLCCPELQDKCKEKALKPQRWCGLTVKSGSVEFEYEWDKNHDFEFSDNYLPNSPLALCSLLWKKELISMGKNLRCDVVNSMAVGKVATIISEIVPLRDIRKAVINKLWERDWSFKNHVSDPRPKPIIQDRKQPKRPIDKDLYKEQTK